MPTVPTVPTGACKCAVHARRSAALHPGYSATAVRVCSSSSVRTSAPCTICGSPCTTAVYAVRLPAAVLPAIIYYADARFRTTFVRKDKFLRNRQVSESSWIYIQGPATPMMFSYFKLNFCWTFHSDFPLENPADFAREISSNHSESNQGPDIWLPWEQLFSQLFRVPWSAPSRTLQSK